jgi:ATF/CREB family transcription factor
MLADPVYCVLAAAALKCRQRKKQWLTQLQAKVEYLTADNETLQSTVGHLRDEVSKLRTILGVHGDCPMNVPPGPTGPGGMTTVGAYMHNLQYQSGPSMQSQQPQHHQR